MESYQVRMYDEYCQLCEKYIKLIRLLRDTDCNMLKFKLNCPLELLKEQADVMKRYIDILEHRAIIEKIELPHYDFYIERGEDYGQY